MIGQYFDIKNREFQLQVRFHRDGVGVTFEVSDDVGSLSVTLSFEDAANLAPHLSILRGLDRINKVV